MISILFMMFSHHFFLQVPLKSLLSGCFDGLTRIKFVDITSVNDFIFLPQYFSQKPADFSHKVMVGGLNSALSIYSIGGKVQFQHIGKFAGYVKDQVGSAISKTLSSFFGGNSSIMGTSDKPLDVLFEEISLPSILDFEDSKRRILRLSIEPRGKLVAAADSLGRVLLFDTRLNCIVR